MSTQYRPGFILTGGWEQTLYVDAELAAVTSPSTTSSPENLAVNLPPTPFSARQARDFVQRSLHSFRLSGEPMLAEPLSMVASELVTNAVLHARTDIEVRLSVTGPGVTLEVTDGAPVAAMTARPGPLATSGRGLVLVAALADAWGVTVLEGGRGKRVWAHLAPAAN